MQRWLDAGWLGLVVVMIAGCAAPLDERLEGYMHEREGEGFAGALLVLQDTTIAFAGGYGMANRARQIANSPETVFPFGSVVKDYTRLAILELELEGRLSRQQQLYDFFADVPADKQEITIQHLLTHTSGLRPYHDPGITDIPADHAPMTRAQALASILEQALLSEPGTVYHYSNSGYTLLAMIIEQVSGQSFVDFITTRILEPAGMTRSGFYRDPRWTPDDVAVGYGEVVYGEENSPVYWPTNAWPVAGNGGMAGPLIDLYRGVRHIESRRSSSPDLDRAWSESTAEDGPTAFHASAGGNDFGFVTVVFYWPERGHGLVLASNNDADGKEDPQMILDLLKMAFDLDPADLGFGQGDADKQLQRAGLDEIPSARTDWGLPDRGTWRRASAFLDAVASRDTSAWRTFVDTVIAPQLRDAFTLDEHIRQLGHFHDLLALPDIAGAERENQILMKLKVLSVRSGETHDVILELEPRAPFRIISMRVD